jgi:dihydrodipicolinate reductase
MGRALQDAIAASEGFVLAAAFDLGDDVAAAVAASDVVLDFTRP